jgi:hypothetical protein
MSLVMTGQLLHEHKCNRSVDRNYLLLFLLSSTLIIIITPTTTAIIIIITAVMHIEMQSLKTVALLQQTNLFSHFVLDVT